MLLDRFTASYYQSRGKLKSLITVKKLELQRDIGVLFSKDREYLVQCLINYHRSDILRSAQTFTDSYKVTFFRFKTKLAALVCHFTLAYTDWPGTLVFIEWLACNERESNGTQIRDLVEPRRFGYDIQTIIVGNSFKKLYQKLVLRVSTGAPNTPTQHAKAVSLRPRAFIRFSVFGTPDE